MLFNFQFVSCNNLFKRYRWHFPVVFDIPCLRSILILFYWDFFQNGNRLYSTDWLFVIWYSHRDKGILRGWCKCYKYRMKIFQTSKQLNFLIPFQHIVIFSRAYRNPVITYHKWRTIDPVTNITSIKSNSGCQYYDI